MVVKRAKFQWCQIGHFIDDVMLFSLVMCCHGIRTVGDIPCQKKRIKIVLLTEEGYTGMKQKFKFFLNNDG